MYQMYVYIWLEMTSCTYGIELVPERDLAGDKLVREVIVLLLQTHVGLDQALVLALKITTTRRRKLQF